DSHPCLISYVQRDPSGTVRDRVGKHGSMKLTGSAGERSAYDFRPSHLPILLRMRSRAALHRRPVRTLVPRRQISTAWRSPKKWSVMTVLRILKPPPRVV